MVDTKRAIATCLKPADEDGYVVRLWETAGRSGPIDIDTKGYKRVFLTDLLERNIEELPIADGRAILNLRPHGFAGLRLLP
jgi:hypothetical protein